MKRFLSLPNLRLAGEILLIVALLLMAFSQLAPTQAASPQSPEAIYSALYWYQCNPVNHVGLFTNRVRIFCQTTTPLSSGAPALSSSIVWFAFPTSPDSAEASRFMSLLQTSVITSRPIWLFLDPNDTSGSGFGCEASNCRRIYGMEMQ